jgi:hypothetical protein
VGGGIKRLIVCHSSFLELESEVLENRTITGLVIQIACYAKAYHACTLLILEGFLPATQVVIKRLAREGLVRIFGIVSSGVGCWCAAWKFVVFTHQSFPRVLVIVGTLLNDGL